MAQRQDPVVIVGAGIVRVVFFGDGPEGWAREVLEAAGVEIVCLPEPPQRNAEGWDAVLLR